MRYVLAKYHRPAKGSKGKIGGRGAANDGANKDITITIRWLVMGISISRNGAMGKIARHREEWGMIMLDAR